MSALLRAFVIGTTSPRLPDEAFYTDSGCAMRIRTIRRKRKR
jgi:hypothetical protein